MMYEKEEINLFCMERIQCLSTTKLVKISSKLFN